MFKRKTKSFFYADEVFTQNLENDEAIRKWKKLIDGKQKGNF